MHQLTLQTGANKRGEDISIIYSRAWSTHTDISFPLQDFQTDAFQQTRTLKRGWWESTKQFHRWRGIDTGCRWRESSLNLRRGGCWWWLCDNCFVIHNNVGEGGTLSNKQMRMLTRNPRQRKTCLPPRKRSCCDWSGKLTTPTSIPSVLGRGGRKPSGQI